jgi:hypothetical protein
MENFIEWSKKKDRLVCSNAGKRTSRLLGTLELVHPCNVMIVLVKMVKQLFVEIVAPPDTEPQSPKNQKIRLFGYYKF